ncbi:MAG TPA: hypothetical protein VHM19_04210, partial [Polyangiales bacterium]|nr:hypothetical protein [Polyangiales bacterium]
MRRSTWWLSTVACVWLVACSIDPSSNPFHQARCKDGRKPFKGFCLPEADGGSANGKDKDASADGSMNTGKPDGGGAGNGGTGGSGGKKDSGSELDAAGDAMLADAAVDSGGDASMPESCPNEGDTRVCDYPANSGTLAHPPCAIGAQTCTGGFWGACQGQVLPSTEVCDLVDNDCDGNTDESLLHLGNCVVPTEISTTPCAAGEAECHNGAITCKQLVFATTETCNDVDDNCDGQKDEGLDVNCYDYATPDGGAAGCTSDGNGGYTCVGACTHGVNKCVGGVMETNCPGETDPVAEVNTNAGSLAKDEDC